MRAHLSNPEAGALATFEGWVRNHNEGKQVNALAYEAYSAMAEKEGGRIIEAAKQQFDILEACCFHRVGELAIGEMAVWVGATAKHRKEALDACEFIINEVKHRVPIWKKEYYADGDSGWVNCERCAEAHDHDQPAPAEAVPSLTPEAYYARQICLSELGAEGQQKLTDARVLVVGAGGLGSPALLYLAAAGIGTLGICDNDQVDVTNLHRQILYQTHHIGQPKASAAAEQLSKLNPFIRIQTHCERFTVDNAVETLKQYDLVLDCTDNFSTRFLLNDAAVLTGTPLIQSSIYQYEGQLQLLRADSDASCLRCLWPTMPDATCIGSCAEVGVLGAVPGVFGTLQAVEALKYLLGLPGALSGRTLLTLDLLTYTLNRIQWPKDPNCPICGEAAEFDRLKPEMYRSSPGSWQIEGALLEEKLSKEVMIIDIREPQEWQPIPGMDARRYQHVPFSRFALEGASWFNSDRSYLLLCQSGIRSGYLAKMLHYRGHSNFYSVAEGLAAIAKLKGRATVKSV